VVTSDGLDDDSGDRGRSGGSSGRRLVGSGAAWARKTAQRASRLPARVPGLADRLPAKLPAGVREQIGQSVRRLAKVRSVKGAKKALIAEAERLFLVVTPLLAAAPLPLTGWQARLAAGGAGGASAAVEQAEELAAFVSWGGALPSAPVVAGAVVTAWVLELWIALSARVNQLKAAGRQVDTDQLARELAGAYIGDPDAVRRDGMARVVRGVAVRAAERWAAGLVPGLGVVFDSFASQRTVARILREPLAAHPPRADGSQAPAHL
jgi:hypothetical protein